MSMKKENIAKNVIHIYKLAKLQENSVNPYTYDKYIFIASHARLSHSSMIPNFTKYFKNTALTYHRNFICCYVTFILIN